MNIKYYTQTQKGKRYRVITDDSLVFDKGEVVVALEDSYMSWCIRESEYKNNFNDINDYSSLVRDTACDVCSDVDLEALEDENYITIADQLYKYNQTGMTPEQIIDLQKEYVRTRALLKRYQSLGSLEACSVAVKKQTPKKVIDYAKSTTSGILYGYCPRCEYVVYAEYACDMYCSNCGQRLDWVSERSECEEE